MGDDENVPAGHQFQVFKRGIVSGHFVALHKAFNLLKSYFLYLINIQI